MEKRGKSHCNTIFKRDLAVRISASLRVLDSNTPRTVLYHLLISRRCITCKQKRTCAFTYAELHACMHVACSMSSALLGVYAHVDFYAQVSVFLYTSSLYVFFSCALGEA